MQFNNLKKNKANRKAKQVGRGGTRGKTSGRGTKGQNARSGRKKRPEMRDIIKRIPKLRGRGKNFLKSRFNDSYAITTGVLEAKFAKGDTVNSATIIEKGILSTRNGKIQKVKILKRGKLTKALKIENIEVSAGAKELIEKLGGTVVLRG